MALHAIHLERNEARLFRSWSMQPCCLWCAIVVSKLYYVLFWKSFVSAQCGDWSKEKNRWRISTFLFFRFRGMLRIRRKVSKKPLLSTKRSHSWMRTVTKPRGPKELRLVGDHITFVLRWHSRNSIKATRKTTKTVWVIISREPEIRARSHHQKSLYLFL